MADTPLLGELLYDGRADAPRAGNPAHIVVFDPDRFAPRADHMHPRKLSRGVNVLLIDGQPAIADGKLTGIAAGRVRLHTPAPGTCP